MPYCMNCGQKLPDGAKYCTSCGAEQSLALETEEKNNSFSEITTELYGQQDMVENPEREETSSARFEQNEQRIINRKYHYRLHMLRNRHHSNHNRERENIRTSCGRLEHL